MNTEFINQICVQEFHQTPIEIRRNCTGIGSYVYTVTYPENRYVVKISDNAKVILGSVYWFDQLKDLNIPIPRIIALNCEQNPVYCIMTYMEGSDLGLVYTTLSLEEKQNIAHQLFTYQNRVRTIPRADGFGFLHSYDDSENKKSSWNDVVYAHIKRSEERIRQNGIFSTRYTDILLQRFPYFERYFSAIQPEAFFDDTTTKNLLIHNGSISGIIDLDWICFGDRLYVIALTTVSLLAMKADLAYIDYWTELEKLTAEQERVLLFYKLIFCADFMSEKGMKFNRDHAEKVDRNAIQFLQNLFRELDTQLQSVILSGEEK